jgi:putative ABC transport system permease protein
MILLQLAWRNIWRNKRRTAITAASIFFAVLFSVAMEAINRGMFEQMIDTSLKSYTGFAQLQNKDYWENRSLDNAFELTPQAAEKLTASDQVNGLIPRLESFALASFKKKTKSTLVIGIDPQKEQDLTKLKKNLVQGSYLTKKEDAVLVAEGLAKRLKINLNDTLILISQGYRGVNAAGKYYVKGILKLPNPKLNKQLVYMPLQTAQYFYGAEQLTTAVVLNMPSRKAADTHLDALTAQVDTNTLTVKNWKSMIPGILEMKQMKESSNLMSILVIYLIVAFGILGTILMMTKERGYEFAVLISIGMRRRLLATTIYLEIILIGLLGIVIGLATAYSLMAFIAANPIPITGEMAATYDQMGIEPLIIASTDFDLFIVQALRVLLLLSIMALYPILKIRKLKPVEAMRS